MEIIIPTSHRQSYMEGFHRFLSGGNSNILNARPELTGMRKSGAEFPIELT